MSLSTCQLPYRGVYHRFVRVVWVSEHGRHFHARQECRRIKAGQHAKQSTATLYSMELKDVDGLAPCRSCYPDAPRIITYKPYCDECRTARPCAHNGGVLCLIPRVWRQGSALLKPGEVTYSRRWVWPEHAHWYEQVQLSS